MTQNHFSISVEEVIEKVIVYAKEQLSKDKVVLLTKFIRFFYGTMALEDMQERSVPDLYGAAISEWKLMLQRKPSEVKIHVFNPKYERDGWRSTHTIIQIIMADMPFLIDSIRMEINRLGLTIHLMIHIGGIKVCRNQKHQIDDVLAYHTEHHKDCILEAPIHIEMDRQTDPKILSNIQHNIRRVLKDVCVVVEDWSLMQERMYETIDELNPEKMLQQPDEIKETKAFLNWLVDNHFIFLGFRDYEMVDEARESALRLIPNSGLGILRDYTHSKMFRRYADLPKSARKMVLSTNQILIRLQNNMMSTVHRPAYVDYVGIKRFKEKTGQLIGERCFIGLYTSDVYRSDPCIIPIIRTKVESILKRSKLPIKSHGYKDIQRILATLPRDDLFHATTDELFDWTMGILHLQERRHIRLFVRKDIYGRFVSCLVYVPRDNFTTDLVKCMQDVLVKTFHGLNVTFTTYFSESILACIHFVIRINPRRSLEYNVKELEKKLVKVGESWQDEFYKYALEHFGEEYGNDIFNRYRYAFSSSYREEFPPQQAVYDVEHIEKLSQLSQLGMNIYRPHGVAKDVIRFKLFHSDFTVPLSDALPMLENMGLRIIGEQPYELIFRDGRRVWINDFLMAYAKESRFEIETVKVFFQEAYEKIWLGVAENDSLNQLVLGAGLTWREISVLRAYTKYFRQVGFTFSEGYIADALIDNSKVAQLLIELFKCYFDPQQVMMVKKEAEAIEEKIQKELDTVAVLDKDRILRQYLALIHATLRTNYFQVDRDSNPKPYLSFKFDPSKIPDMPLPLPKYEIFVYSPRFEGVHLRAAKVARGGIRWSERREDYRTEILGLMKAQQVKNSIIVPAGAKGGFLPKRLSLDLDAYREEVMQEGVFCYRNFISGLLDLTDNLKDGQIISPESTICYDGSDPYLVVAADKGTATFSDIANDVAIEKGYWMGDAFASGGSTGYDHKKMGITARGAWVAARRHFQDLGIKLDEVEITVVGIGDMSGDVFGNGMLLSHQIKLVAAFDHRHIFLDPDPVPLTSYNERLRLFHLLRSSWNDYDRALLSKGGGVYSRMLKAIRLSPEIKTLLQVTKDIMVPNELIRAILKAPVDMIWNGGIGTYIKSSQEKNIDVGDRSNDNLRVNAKNIRSRVICEGGNLGVTQLGRIEYELNGGKINTDFIDNSAGVDCSDHEVNVKILLNYIVAQGNMTEKQRNELLASMTDEVARLVLEDNYFQNKTLSLASYLAVRDFELNKRFLDVLEQERKINRSLEFLPDDKTLLERRAAGLGLTRPELSILLAYSKIILKAQVKASSLVEDSYLSRYVADVFPTPLRRRFSKHMKAHYLSKEIIATQLSNRLISMMGIPFLYQMQDELGVSIPSIMRAFITAIKIFQVEELLTNIDTLDYKIETKVQYQMNVEAIRLIRRASRWLLRHHRGELDIAVTINHFSDYVGAIYSRLPKLLLGADKQAMNDQQKSLIEQHVPAELALRIAGMPSLFHALNIIEAATSYHEEVFRVAKIYFMLVDRLDLFWFREKINTYPVSDRWAVLARAGYKGDLDYLQRELTVRVLLDTKARSIPGKINEWFTEHEPMIQRWQNILAAMRNVEKKDFAILFVAIRELFDLAASIL
ncbi:NAD-glutamate dehydrogenase [Coxiella endosymbiont of Amblyomma nuttalli]|uniref:NAD-glutamate dehydrogenase n=1 Tax=Coxiella endosymbiont of Amblyomma nuttalli TaxID=2749996 RepID=UPI001BA6754C|nr:NAD-glutamate dehydrogenase [Coxiella endosymbiont of Amblyomma nuttalli]QTS83910.1 NAD-specific glutamate dehydrogenase [Coxiella endosymbiont of Amblyomma nuttalli]